MKNENKNEWAEKQRQKMQLVCAKSRRTTQHTDTQTHKPEYGHKHGIIKLLRTAHISWNTFSMIWKWNTRRTAAFSPRSLHIYTTHTFTLPHFFLVSFWLSLLPMRCAQLHNSLPSFTLHLLHAHKWQRRCQSIKSVCKPLTLSVAETCENIQTISTFHLRYFSLIASQNVADTLTV